MEHITEDPYDRLMAELEIAHLHEKVDHLEEQVLAKLDAIEKAKRAGG